MIYLSYFITDINNIHYNYYCNYFLLARSIEIDNI